MVTPSPTGPPSREVQDGVTVHGVRSHRYFRHEHFQVCVPWEAFPATTDAARRDRARRRAHPGAHGGRARIVLRGAGGRRPLVATNHLMPENLAAYTPVSRAGCSRRTTRWPGRTSGGCSARPTWSPHPPRERCELLVARAGLTRFPVSCGIDADRYQVPRRAPHARADGAVRGAARPGEAGRRADPGDGRAAGRLPAALEIVGDGRAARRLDGPGRRAGDERAGPRSAGTSPTTSCCRPTPAPRCSACRASPSCRAIATLEAMAAGTPVIAADAMALPHLVRPGRNGWLYRPATSPS